MPYLMRIGALMDIHRIACMRFTDSFVECVKQGKASMEDYPEMYGTLTLQHAVELEQLREDYRAMREQAKAEKMRIAELREQRRVAREEAKAAKMLEKMRVGERSKEPAFWIANPNDDGRRDTMMAVLTAAGRNWPTDHVNDMMPAYARWLLTANKTNEAGRPMNRWALMTAFLVGTLRVPTPLSHGAD